LNLRGSSISIFGVVMAMAAAVCLASYFLVSAKDTITLPPVALTGLGMGVGSLAMSLIVLAGILPAGAAFGDVDFGGIAMSWIVPMSMIVVFTVGAYVTGILGLRYIGATVGSFVNLVEVPFSVIVAWLVLFEMPAPIQLFGGVFILGGVGFVKWVEARLARRVARREGVARSEHTSLVDAGGPVSRLLTPAVLSRPFSPDFDAVAVALLGEEAAALSGEVLIDGVGGDHGVEGRRALILLRTQDPPEPLGLLLT